MNRYYNHINHFVDTNDYFHSNANTSTLRQHCLWQDLEHEAKQLDGKQRHTWFNYYEYDMPKFGTPDGWVQWAQIWNPFDRNSFNFQKNHENFEHYQPRRHGIHGHGHSQTCSIHRSPPGSQNILVLYVC